MRDDDYKIILQLRSQSTPLAIQPAKIYLPRYGAQTAVEAGDGPHYHEHCCTGEYDGRTGSHIEIIGQVQPGHR